MPETRITYVLTLKSTIGAGGVLDAVVITGVLDFRSSENAVSRETNAPDEGRVIHGTREIEMNTNKWVNLLVEEADEFEV